MTCWFRSWKWSRELFFLRSLFLVWPKSTATESSLLYPVAVLSKCSKLSNLAASLQFLNHHSGSVWWAWSQRPREGRQTRLGGCRGWSAVARKVSPWEKGRDTWPGWCGKTGTPSSWLWMRTARMLADLLSLIGPAWICSDLSEKDKELILNVCPTLSFVALGLLLKECC